MDLSFFDPGRLTARLTLERPVETPDGQGGATLAFDTVAHCWALVEPIAMPEALERGQDRFRVSHRIRLRHRDDLTAGMRLRLGARIFTIRSHRDPDGTGRVTVCRCEEETL